MYSDFIMEKYILKQRMKRKVCSAQYIEKLLGYLYGIGKIEQNILRIGKISWSYNMFWKLTALAKVFLLTQFKSMYHSIQL